MRSTSSPAGFAATVASLDSVLHRYLALRQLWYTGGQIMLSGTDRLTSNSESGICREWNQGRSEAFGASTGSGVMVHGKVVAGKRVLIVEDELMIRMLLEGMLTDLGHSVAAEAGGLDEAISLAKQAEFDLAVLDVNLNGTPVTPVVEILIQRGVPFIFASGYGQRGLPEAYRTAPILQKPFQTDALEEAIRAVANGVS
jgi:CheY-like chemotaxis protein